MWAPESRVPSHPLPDGTMCSVPYRLEMMETSWEDVKVEPRQMWPGLTFWGKRAAGLSPEPSALDNLLVLRVSCCPWVLRHHACSCVG